jgi:hypothetical protein
MPITAGGRFGRLGRAALVGGAAVVVAATVTISNRVGRSSSFSFKDYINGRDSRDYPHHLRSGIFLGTGQYADEAGSNPVLQETNPYCPPPQGPGGGGPGTGSGTGGRPPGPDKERGGVSADVKIKDGDFTPPTPRNKAPR